jgi:ParB family chromosome partitioning protein
MKKKTFATQAPLADLRVEALAVEQVIPHAGNAKLHPPEQVAQIAASIQAFGFNDPVAVDEKNVIIEGHGRLLAARQLGLKTVPVIRLPHLSEAQKKAYILAHNKLCLNTGWYLDLLRLELQRLQELDFDLNLSGFRPAEIEILFTLPSFPDTEPELTAEGMSAQDTKPVQCPACGERFHA